jgi:hypothetical protein
VSGGHYPYEVTGWLHQVADQIERELGVREPPEKPARIAFAKLLRRVADALHDLDYVDSGDTSWGPESSMRRLFAVIGPKERLEAAIEQAREAQAMLAAELARCEVKP